METTPPPTERLEPYPLNLRQKLAAYCLHFFFRVMHATYRYRYFNGDARDAAARSHPNGGFALALYHEHIFASLGAHSHQRVAPIISHSRDGEIASLVSQRMGLFPARGSSSRGGSRAKSEVESMIARGYNAAVTVDGPRGPRRQSKLGILAIARATGCAILPSVAIASRSWVLRSWDRFKIPKPFARIAVIYGTPLRVAQEEVSKSALVHHKTRLEEAINSLDDRRYLDDPQVWRTGMTRAALLRRYDFGADRISVVGDSASSRSE